MNPIDVGIFDLSRGTGRLDSELSQPLSLLQSADGSVALDWVNIAIDAISPEKTVYFGSYQIQKVIERFPHFEYRYAKVFNPTSNEQSLSTTELQSLLEFLKQSQNDVLAIKANTILLPEATSQLVEPHKLKNSSSNKIGWGTLSEGSNTIFSGALFIPLNTQKHLIRQIEVLIGEHTGKSFNQLFEYCQRNNDDQFDWVNLDGICAPNQNQAAIVKTLFKGKAKTLEQLRAISSDFVVLEQVSFTVREWRSNQDAVLDKIKTEFGHQTLVARSSTIGEDSRDNSAAGFFESLLDLTLENKTDFIEAVEKVVSSYSKLGREVDPADSVLVQPQVKNIVSSGVAFSREINTRAPYFVICIDRKSGRSDSVTSGSAAEHDTYYVVRDAEITEVGLEQDVSRLVKNIRALINYTCFDELDIEFAFDKQNTLYLFQLRPLVFKQSGLLNHSTSDQDLYSMLSSSARFIEALFQPDCFLVGEHNVLSNMSDWNPAEMLGNTPRPLALSLYQYLIGSEVWAEARAELGYFDASPAPLVLSVGGKPYIDLRASLNSLMPNDLDETIRNQWINYCLNRVKGDPTLHDKIEFEVTPSCFLLDWSEFEKHFKQAGLTEREIKAIKSSFLQLSLNLVNEKTFEQSFSQLATLSARRLKLESAFSMASTNSTNTSRVILNLVEDCKRLGTLPFAKLARQGFIALILLRQLSALELLDKADVDKLVTETPTIALEIKQAVNQLEQGKFGFDEFEQSYGHLRERSYEITSPSYRQVFATNSSDLSLDKKPFQKIPSNSERLSQVKVPEGLKLDKLASYLQKNSYSLDANDLILFIQKAIYAREQAKFEFMKSVDSILKLVELFCSDYQLSTDDASYLTIHEVLKFADSSDSGAAERTLKRSVGFNRKRMQLTRAVHLPEVIVDPNQLFAFKLIKGRPNFVTQQCVEAEISMLSQSENTEQLAGKIVVIEAADPGYDWIFSHSIAGLITCYGGIGSHMAIRSAEFQIPAAIGCGDAIFSTLKTSQSVLLDCANQRLSFS